MSQAATAQEPTMEEILASIRRIISDEEGDAASGETSAMEPQAVADMASALEDAFVGKHDLDDATSDVRFEVDEAEVEPAPDADMDAAAIDAMMAAEPVAEAEPVEEPVAQAEPAMEEEHIFPQASAAPAAMPIAEAGKALISETASHDAAAAFGKLSHLVMSQNARTLDDIVTEMMRPMLSEWIEDNLPPLVERLVQDEIKRISRGG